MPGTPLSRRSSQASQMSTTGLLSRSAVNAAPSPPPLGPRKLSDQGALGPLPAKRGAFQTSVTLPITQSTRGSPNSAASVRPLPPARKPSGERAIPATQLKGRASQMLPFNGAAQDSIRTSALTPARVVGKLSGPVGGPTASGFTQGYLDNIQASCYSAGGISRNELDAIIELADMQLPSRSLKAQRIVLESFKARVQANLAAGKHGPERMTPSDSFRIDLISKIDTELAWNAENAKDAAPTDLDQHLLYLVGFLLAVSDLESREERRQAFMKQQRKSDEAQ